MEEVAEETAVRAVAVVEDAVVVEDRITRAPVAAARRVFAQVSAAMSSTTVRRLQRTR